MSATCWLTATLLVLVIVIAYRIWSRRFVKKLDLAARIHIERRRGASYAYVAEKFGISASEAEALEKRGGLFMRLKMHYAVDKLGMEPHPFMK